MMAYSIEVTEPKRGVYAVLDLGSSKMACLVIRTTQQGEPEVVGFSSRASDGVSGGVITNKHHAGYALLSCIDLAEQNAEETVSQVYVTFSGCNLRSHRVSNEVVFNEHEITERDIRRAMLKTYDKFQADDLVVHNVPVEYQLDKLNNVTELTGLYGSSLRVNLHVVTAARAAMVNIEHCITGNNQTLGGCIAEPYASGEACLTDDEKEIGTLIVDMGGHHTSLGLFSEGRIAHVDSIPFGGQHITRDIAYGLCTSVKTAERVKVMHGTAVMPFVEKDHQVEIEDVNGERQAVMRSEITKIIRPRVEEILEFVREKIDDHGGVNRVVITGGCSKLCGVEDVALSVLDRPVRVGEPAGIKGLPREYGSNPEYAAAIGTAKIIADAVRKRVAGAKAKHARSPSSVEKVLRWLIAKVEV